MLLRKRAVADASLPGVAPGLAWLGAMLPYTPLHYLLFHEAAGDRPAPRGSSEPQDLVLVMTSANPGGEPLVTGNDEARQAALRHRRALLVHDRAIVTRCDDSVLRAAHGASAQRLPVRPPRPRLHAAGDQARPIRAVRRRLGGYFKNTVCVTRGDEAFVSQHIGDLDNAPTCAALVDAVEHLTSILEVEPQLVAHDLHPDFFSTRHAARLAQRLRRSAASACSTITRTSPRCSPSTGSTAPVLGLALDGVGLGSDGGAWGGELLRVDGARFERLGHLAPLRLPGGDVAAREPWRMAAAALARCRRERRSRAASPTSRRRRRSQPCSRAVQRAGDLQRWAACSTPRRDCSA